VGSVSSVGSAGKKEGKGGEVSGGASSSIVGKDRAKVCKPPPDTKRPPRLMQTPCAFVQTSSIYANPLAEIAKIRGGTGGCATPGSSRPGSSPAAVDALDLSPRAQKRPRLDDAPLVVGGLNLKREHQLLQQQHLQHNQQQQQHQHLQPTLDLSLKKESSLLAAHAKQELKASPFSAEALLSKSSKAPPSHYPGLPGQQTHELVKVPPIQAAMQAAPGRVPDKRASPVVHPRASPASAAAAMFAPTSGSPADRGKEASPWHTPVVSNPASMGTTSSAVAAMAAAAAGMPPSLALPPGAQGKPAIPVSPVVREDHRKESPAVSSYAGLLPPSSTVTSAAMSLPIPPSTLSSLATSTSLTHSSLAAAASNPYLALMNQGLSGSKTPSAASAASASAAAAAAAGYPAHLMDPATSAYYAALYSQQMYGAAGLSPYGLSGAGLRPPGAPPIPGLDALQQAQALQALMGRAPTPSSSTPNPYGSAAAAAAAAAGFPGLGGMHGFPGFPPPRKDP